MSDITLVPMTAHDLELFIHTEILDCAESHVREGSWARREALRLARDSLTTVTTWERQATAVECQRLWTAVTATGQHVGWLWVKLPPAGPWTGSAFLCQMTVRRELRHQGFGRGMLAALEAQLARDGLTELRMNVWETNGPAKALYASAGYALAHQFETMRQLRKLIGPAADTELARAG
ncbi:MAG: GNAT family N-acetyltransferase [Chloroflexota bacterium]